METATYNGQLDNYMYFFLSLVGWLFWVQRSFETVLLSISGRLPETGRKRREKWRRVKLSKQPPSAPAASTLGPCPTNCRTLRHLKFTQDHRTTLPPPHVFVQCTVPLCWTVMSIIEDVLVRFSLFLTVSWVGCYVSVASL